MFFLFLRPALFLWDKASSQVFILSLSSNGGWFATLPHLRQGRLQSCVARGRKQKKCRQTKEGHLVEKWWDNLESGNRLQSVPLCGCWTYSLCYCFTVFVTGFFWQLFSSRQKVMFWFVGFGAVWLLCFCGILLPACCVNACRCLNHMRSCQLEKCCIIGFAFGFVAASFCWLVPFRAWPLWPRRLNLALRWGPAYLPQTSILVQDGTWPGNGTKNPSVATVDADAKRQEHVFLASPQ